MGDSITEGTLKEWLKKEGEFAAADEIIAEIETDKIVVEFRMPEAGTIVKLGAAAGDNVEVRPWRQSVRRRPCMPCPSGPMAAGRRFRESVGC